jgi:hypothetical protein
MRARDPGHVTLYTHLQRLRVHYFYFQTQNFLIRRPIVIAKQSDYNMTRFGMGKHVTRSSGATVSSDSQVPFASGPKIPLKSTTHYNKVGSAHLNACHYVNIDVSSLFKSRLQPMSVKQCTRLLHASSQPDSFTAFNSFRALNPTPRFRLPRYRDYRVYTSRPNIEMAPKWAEGPFQLIETPEFRQKVY